jgi:hypothetical protein
MCIYELKVEREILEKAYLFANLIHRNSLLIVLGPAQAFNKKHFPQDTITMTSDRTPDLPNTGSTYPHTKSEAISFSSNPFGAAEGAQQQHQSSAVSGSAENTARRGSSIPAQPTNYSDDANPLQSHHRPSLSVESTEGVQALTGQESMGRHSISQNAPGKLGYRGENVLGAMGFGGSKVERPKEDQGIGEKIAEFLGA